MRKEIFQENNVKWTHISRPSKADIEFIKNAFPFHPLIIESIVAPTLHPAIEEFGDHLFLILHFPLIYRERVSNAAAEVDFLITKNALFTITYKDYPKLDELFERIAHDFEIRKKFSDHHTGPAVYGIIDWLLSSLIHDIDSIEEEVVRIENEIFERQGISLVEDISHARRDILDFRRVLLTSETVLQVLPQVAAKFYGEEMDPYFADLLTAESKMQHLIENQKETIEALQATHESLLSNKISRIISVLTIFSVIIMPLNLIASIWGMNQQYMPLRDNPHDFWIIIGGMFFVFAALLAIFHYYKRWL